MRASISELSGFRFAIIRRRSASFMSFAVCLSFSIAVTSFIRFNVRSMSMENEALRLVTWNIEKGKRWPLIDKCLQHDSIRTAGILCLNEVDDGMARSGNPRL